MRMSMGGSYQGFGATSIFLNRNRDIDRLVAEFRHQCAV